MRVDFKKKALGSGLLALALGVAVISSTPAFAGGAVVEGGGRGPPGGGGHGPPGVCRNGPCDPHGSTIGGGNKGTKCKPNGEGCGKQF